ncbi:MAG: hypothetical protein C0406_08650 [Sideroxydans sp.]|nr:hypothetical protein [Sideroxydans sp.]
MGVAVLLSVVWSWPKQEAVNTSLKIVEAIPVETAFIKSQEVLQEVAAVPASKLSYELSIVPSQEALVEVISLRPNSSQAESKSIKSRSNLVAPSQRVTAEAKPVSLPPPTMVGIPLKQVSRAQQAEAELRKATALQQQGHIVEALAGYETALSLNAQLDTARLALAALLMESRRSADAERVLHEGLKIKPLQLGFSMALARVQVENGAIESALATMERNLLQADNKADYQAFYAALLQRKDRHKEAVNHYQIALQLAPNNGVWLMGFGISLQEIQRFEDAKAAYHKALATNSLSPQLTAFVQQKLKGL